MGTLKHTDIRMWKTVDLLLVIKSWCTRKRDCLVDEAKQHVQLLPPTTASTLRQSHAKQHANQTCN